MKIARKSPELLILLMTIGAAISWAVWLNLLNNFAIEKVDFTGAEIGILQPKGNSWLSSFYCHSGFSLHKRAKTSLYFTCTSWDRSYDNRPSSNKYDLLFSNNSYVCWLSLL